MKIKLTDRDWLILSTTLTILGLAGIYSDFFLSFNAYNANPEHFVRYENCRDVAYFFHSGAFPFSFLFTVLSFPIGISLLVYIAYKFNNFRYQFEYLIVIVAFTFILCWMRIFAGLTWYLPTYELTNAIQTILFVILGVILTLIFIISKEEKNEDKSSDKSSNM